MQSLKWIDTYQALIVPSIFTAFGIFLMRQSCAVIPNELIEAARMDGANEFYIFHRIIIPQLNNAIVSMSVFQFLWAWDDYLWPFLMIRDTKKQLLPVALNLFSGQYSTDYAGLFAATSIAIIPVVIFYIIFQKKFPRLQSRAKEVFLWLSILPNSTEIRSCILFSCAITVKKETSVALEKTLTA